MKPLLNTLPARRDLCLLPLIGWILMSACAPALAQRGTVDVSFGSAGQLVTTLGDFGEIAHAVVIQSDGNIVAGGFTQESFVTGDFALVRYQSDGSLDPTFGNGGKVVTPIEHQSKGQSLALQEDGKIVLAGSSKWYINLARYKSSGALDTAFGTNGVVVTDVDGYYNETCESVALQPDGKIVLAGFAQHISNDMGHVLLARYQTDGTPDSTFGTDGIVIGSLGQANALALQSNGNISVAGSYDNDVLVQRYLSDGSLDLSFGTAGQVITPMPNSSAATGLVIQADGKLVIGGNSSSFIIIARYLSDGSLDNSFATGGYTIGTSGKVRAVQIQENGKILLGGESNSAMTVFRFLADGTLDSGFGSGGSASTPVGNSSTGFGMDVQNDGKIVLCGYTYNGTNTDMALVRYHGDELTGTPDLTDQNSATFLYPNPFQTTATLQFAAPLINAELLMFDALGQAVRQMSGLSGPSVELDRSNLPAGSYFLQVIDTGKVVFRDKVVVMAR